MKKVYYVYMMTNEFNTVIYTGVTNDLARRVYEHQKKSADGFTQRYKVTKLVYVETFDKAYDAIKREKQLKGGSRKKKLDLIHAMNPKWIKLDIN